MVVGFDAVAFILGLGYVMGLRSSMVLVAGGVLSTFVLVPLVWMIGEHLPDAVYPATVPIASMTSSQTFRGYVRFIGVGAIATAGIFGIIKCSASSAPRSRLPRACSAMEKRRGSAPTGISR